MNEKMICHFCGQTVLDENNKVKILDKIMCQNCEKKLVNLTVSDERYLFYKEKIKNLWFA